MKLLSATQYTAPNQLSLPVPHEGRVFMRTPEKKLIAMNEATGEVSWMNSAEHIEFPKVIWQGRLVADYTKKVRLEGGAMLDAPIGLALIHVETGHIERAFECDWPQQALAVGPMLLGSSLGAVHALDFETGRTVWKWKSPAPGKHVSSLPVVDGRAVYFGLDDGSLVALDQKTGRELWLASVANLTYDWGGGDPRHAHVYHLAVHGGFLVCSAHAWWVLGLRVEDGTQAWVQVQKNCGSWEAEGYGGLHHVLNGGRLVTFDPAAGRVVSDHDLARSLPKELRGAVPTMPFLVSDTHVFTGSQRGAVMAFERETGRYVWGLQPEGGAATGQFSYNHRFAVGDKRLYYWDASLRVYCLAEDEAAPPKAAAKTKGVRRAVAGKPTARKPAARRRTPERVAGGGREKKAVHSAQDRREAILGINVGFIYDPEPNVKGAHPESEIRLVADNLEELDDLARRSRERTLSKLGLGDDPEGVDPDGLEMLDPKDGIRTLEVLLAQLRKDPERNPEMHYPEVLIEELEELHGCLQKAASQRVRFRFALEL